MNKKSNIMKAITYEYPTEIPFSIGFLPAAWGKRLYEISSITKRYPDLFGNLGNPYKYDENALARTYRLGETIDEWGCVWTNVEEGRG